MASKQPKDNPYLAAMPKASRSTSLPVATKESLFGFIPRKVKGDSVRKAMVRMMLVFLRIFLSDAHSA